MSYVEKAEFGCRLEAGLESAILRLLKSIAATQCYTQLMSQQYDLSKFASIYQSLQFTAAKHKQ